MSNLTWNHAFGLRARTISDDPEMHDRSVGVSMSRALYMTCDYKRIPQDPIPPDARQEDLEAGCALQQRTHEDIVHAAFRAARRGSARAFVLLENYRPWAIDLGIVSFNEPIARGVERTRAKGAT